MKQPLITIALAACLGVVSGAVSAWTLAQGGAPIASPGAAPYPPLPAERVRQRPGQVRLTQSRSDEQYVLEIALDGLPPENVQVRPLGQALLVRTRFDARQRRSETLGDGQGYRERFSMRSGASTRRLPVPPDGDLSRLQRQDGDDRVRVLIPRRSAASRGPVTPGPVTPGPVTPGPARPE